MGKQISVVELARQVGAWACYDCGKCTATCPIARQGRDYSPRRNVLAAGRNGWQEVFSGENLFLCLTCGLCDLRCPAQVDYTRMIQRLREAAHGEGFEPECPHGGVLQSMMRIMARGDARQDRLAWLEGGLETSPEKGEVFYWTGCAMYYDALFSDLEVSSLDGVRAAIALMNLLGVTPVVSPEERCCGHDLLWNGDRAGFEKLARHNVSLVARSGAKLLVTSCAECLRTWKIDYGEFFEQTPPRVAHISEFLVEHLPELRFRSSGQRRVTYQDPCRLGRHLGIYEPPRELLSALPGIEFVEMRHCGPAAACCAGGTWSNCDRFAKRMQVERLREARSTQADVLVTACPKCQIHLRCAVMDPTLKTEVEIPMRDLAEIVREAVVEAGVESSTPHDSAKAPEKEKQS